MTIEDILKAFGGGAAVAVILGIDRTAPHHWKRVPQQHFDALLEAARNRKIDGITLESLAGAKKVTP